DLTIFLDIDVETALSRLAGRGHADRIESDGDGFMGRVAEGYRELAGRHPERVVTVSAGRLVEEVAKDVRERVGTRVRAIRGL
ncbi:MAG: hypothetical protein LBT65_01195, partial [Synergistaceae bacterium]|nr:hypothetical protein [Synergistaceae bacterium]